MGRDSHPQVVGTSHRSLSADSAYLEVVVGQVVESKMKTWWRWVRLVIFLAIAGWMMKVSAHDFRLQWRHEWIKPSPALTGIKRLSEYHYGINLTNVNTDVYFFKGEEPGGTVLILGGTHPCEPAGYMAAIMMMENLQVKKGRIIVIPLANASGFTATEPQEAFPQYYAIAKPDDGYRIFRMGSRFTNVLDGWPDPEVYLHYPSKQLLSGNETRNLNRAYPGRPDGSKTEQLAYAITQLVRKEKVDLVIDLHEAAPEYPVVNAIVFHERAKDLAAWAALTLQSEGIDISLEPSPPNFHGLSHRELGDYTPTMAVLLETAGVIQGRLRGKTDANLIITGDDPYYYKAAQMGYVRVPYPKGGIPIEVRVGRHLSSIQALLDALEELYPEKQVKISGLPHYAEVVKNGVGAYLSPPPQVKK
jgi:hypothetical protein